MQSHRNVTVTYTYIFEILLEIFLYPWISLSTRSSNIGISMRLRLVLTGICELGYRPCPRAVSALWGGTRSVHMQYTSCFSAPFPPSRFLRLLLLFFVVERAERNTSSPFRRYSHCSFRVKSCARRIKNILTIDRLGLNKAHDVDVESVLIHYCVVIIRDRYLSIISY